MKIREIKLKGNWREVADPVRITVNMKPGQGEPFYSWERSFEIFYIKIIISCF